MDRPTLARALASVARQSWPAIEIVIVAACGLRHRPIDEAALGRRVRMVVPERPADRACAANIALQHATGEFCNFLDDDDEFLPDHVRHLAGLLAAQPRSVLGYGRQQVVDESLTIVGTFGDAWSRAALFDRPCFGMAAAMFRRHVVQLGCRFDERLRMGEDHDFWLQCAAFGPFVESRAVTSRWHAFIGTSGGGAGRNDDGRGKRAAAAFIKRKWRAVRRAYLATPRGRLERVQFALRELRIGHALELAERAVSSLPDDVNALSLAALANHHAGRSERAVELIGRALAIAPGNAQLEANREIIGSPLPVA